uniref:Uncharacterized protein n=1 Tax=Romanomermis culicivorax TaxID=13658 RepID=A0A915HY88_ROMCU
MTVKSILSVFVIVCEKTSEPLSFDWIIIRFSSANKTLYKIVECGNNILLSKYFLQTNIMQVIEY